MSRVRHLRLRGHRVLVSAHGPATAWEERLLRFGGSAAGRVLASRCGDSAVVVAVGDAVRRGLPGAERTSFLWRDPEGGHAQQAQAGGGFARRFARHHDALAIEGRLDRPSVLVVDDGVDARPVPEAFTGWSVAQRALWLREELGGDGWTVGPAAQRGLRFATLATLHEPRGSVGRGGLGAALARANVVALVARGEPAAPIVDERFRLYLAALRASPHLAARAAGGTFEAASVEHAQGGLDEAGARSLLALVDAARAQRHGCAGCPTPCGLVFERPHARQGGRYGAVQTLFVRLGLPDADAALRLLHVCDELGIDAKEAALRLEQLVDAAPAPHERPAWAEEQLRAWCAEPSRAPAPRAADGLKLAGSSLATLLALQVSSRGSDPMRVQPFLADLASSGASAGRAARLLSPLALPEGAEDPLDPRGKGRLVWWSENVALALDATGACAFSGAGLLADGVLDLDGLARLVAPEEATDLHGAEAGRRFFALGSALASLARSGAVRREAPAASPLQHPGMLPEYERLRGELLAWIDPSWAVEVALARQIDHDARQGLLAPHPRPAGAPDGPGGARADAPRHALPADAGAPRASAGRVRLEALGGDLAELDGSTWEYAQGDTVEDLCARIVLAHPHLAARLEVAAFWSAGRKCAGFSPLVDGGRYELVLALAGG